MSEAMEDELIDAQLAAFQRDQIKLDDKELEMEINRALSATDPQAAQNYSMFNYRERVFKKDELVDQMVIHFSMDGCLLKKGEKEFEEQEDAI